MFFSGGSEKEFMAEIQLMAKLRHPNVTSVLGVTTKNPPLRLILEFHSRGSCYQLIVKTSSDCLIGALSDFLETDDARNLTNVDFL